MAATVLALPMLAPSSAGALITPAQAIDGPSPEIVDLGGVAMAPDGSGGLVYRKRVDGRSHIFVSRLVEGVWTAGRRVDAGQRFDSSWPVIGAGDGGRLVVTWVQEFGSNSDRLYYATLDPGASRFQGPLVLDGNVGEATSTFPSLAMNGSGQAYLAYRAPTGTGTNPGFPPGYVDFDVRVARFDGAFWSVLGTLADRNPAAPVRPSTAANAPRAGIDVSGTGIVAFQEPDDELIDRIWARRIFGQTLGIPLLVSPQTWGGKPLRGGQTRSRSTRRDSGRARSPSASSREAAPASPDLGSWWPRSPSPSCPKPPSSARRDCQTAAERERSPANRRPRASALPRRAPSSTPTAWGTRAS